MKTGRRRRAALSRPSRVGQFLSSRPSRFRAQRSSNETMGNLRVQIGEIADHFVGGFRGPSRLQKHVALSFSGPELDVSRDRGDEDLLAEFVAGLGRPPAEMYSTASSVRSSDSGAKPPFVTNARSRGRASSARLSAREKISQPPRRSLRRNSAAYAA